MEMGDGAVTPSPPHDAKRQPKNALQALFRFLDGAFDVVF
jgi:hypothetical protein